MSIAEQNLELRPFDDFKEDYVKVCDHTVNKPDDQVILYDIIAVKRMPKGISEKEIFQKQDLCGTPACILGNMPEALPHLFIYTEGLAVEVVPEKQRENTSYGSIAALLLKEPSGPEDWNNTQKIIDEEEVWLFLFGSNLNCLSDKEEILRRRDVVQECESWEDFFELIKREA